MIVITQNIDISFKLHEIRFYLVLLNRLFFICNFTNKMMKFVGKTKTSETVNGTEPLKWELNKNTMF